MQVALSDKRLLILRYEVNMFSCFFLHHLPADRATGRAIVARQPADAKRTMGPYRNKKDH
jgi:hypothetical protein